MLVIPKWILLIFSMIGMVLTIVALAQAIGTLIDRTILRKERERRQKRKEAEAAKWLGQWGA